MKPARVSGLDGGGGHCTPGRVLGSLLLAVAALLVLCSSAMALAERGHVLERTFGGPGSGAGQLSEPKGVAINEASGDVYVVDAGNNRVDRFSREGVFIEAWGWGVRTGAKVLETCTTETKCLKGIAGHGKGELHGAEAIAIDNAVGSPSKGDVYVEAIKPFEETIGNHEIEFEKTVYDKFSPAGKLEGQIKGWKEKGESTEPFEEPHGITVDQTGAVWIYNEESLFKFTDELKNKFVKEVESEAGEGRQGVAVDSSGNLYVAYEGGAPTVGEEPPSVIAKLLPNGEVAVQELTGEDSTGVAVGPSTQDVFVDNITKISVFDSSGKLIDSFGAGQIGHGTGVTAAGTGEPGASEVAVADSGSNTVHLYEPEPRGVPKVEEASVAAITATSARLTALIDPTGFETEYSFRYSTEPLPPVSEACGGACHETAAAKIGAGFSDVSVEPEVNSLTPGTTYHYQVIARNSAGKAESAEQLFKTAPEVFGATLPDSRQWQMVTPSNKNGALIPALTGESEVVQASEDGTGITYVSTGALPGAEGSRVPEASQILSRRGTAEWLTTDLDTRHEEAEGLATGVPFEYRWFTPDLSKALVQPFGQGALERPPLNKLATEHTPYIRSNAPSPCLAPPVPEECFTPLLTAGNVAETEIEGKKVPVPYGGRVNFVAATPDLSHSVLSSTAALTAGTGKSGNLFEWAAGHLALVSILPGGEAAASPALGAGNLNVRNAISEDGSKVIFSGATGTQTHLYVRDISGGKTAQIDEPQAGTEPPVGIQNPTFQTASPDGSRIFFSDEQRLTKDSTASSKFHRPDLYECLLGEDEAHKLACTLHDLTVDAHAGESANLQGAVIGSSTDATTLYFVANGSLTPEAPSGNCRPGEESGNQGQFVLTAKCDLYMDRYNPAGETWTLTFVTQLSAEDEPDWAWSPTGNLGRLTSRVSPDGNWVTFMSDRSLTGYHNRDTVSGKLDEEVYTWGTAAEKVSCVSCNPNGARPTGVFDSTNPNESGEGVGLLVDRPASYKERWLSASLPGWTHLSIFEARYASRALNNSGRVYFMSAEGLVPQDTNGKEDVYQFEPAGVGGCTGESETFHASLGGCVSLISSGKSPRESAFLDASPTGNDVFFVTAAALAPSDTDEAFDVYDASVCGVAGSPACLPAPAATPKPCEDVSECRTATNTPPPSFGAPPTSSTGASGNIVAPGGTSGVLSSTTTKPTTVVVKPLTRAQKLAKALKACRKLKKKSKRHSCEATARKRYGPVKKGKAKKATAAARGRVGR